MPGLPRLLRRSAAGLVYGGGVGVGLQQHLHNPRSAVRSGSVERDQGDVERGATVFGDCVHVGVGLQQHLRKPRSALVVRSFRWSRSNCFQVISREVENHIKAYKQLRWLLLMIL